MNQPFSFAGGSFIDWRQPAEAIARNLPASAYAVIDGLVVTITKASAGGIHSVYPPGTIIRCDEHVWVQSGVGHVVIEKVRDNQGEMSAPEFFGRNNITVGDAFTPPAVTRAA